MARFCGGIRLDSATLKVLKGVICDAGAVSVDVANAVSTCGQLWDGATFLRAMRLARLRLSKATVALVLMGASLRLLMALYLC